MENKKYKNYKQSMLLSHHWYCAGEELASDLRYGLFEPSNELVIEFMEEEGYFYLSEVIKGCEYTKNVDLLYIITTYLLAKWKVITRTKTKEEFLVRDEEICNCLYASLKTIYRLFKEEVILSNNRQIIRILEDYEKNVDQEQCKIILDVLLKEYLGRSIELSSASEEFINNEVSRFRQIEEIKSNHGSENYDELLDNINRIDFITSALKEGMISFQSDGTIKSPFIEEENNFKVDPEILFMLNEKVQADIIRENIDNGTLSVIEGVDFLKAPISRKKL